MKYSKINIGGLMLLGVLLSGCAAQDSQGTIGQVHEKLPVVWSHKDLFEDSKIEQRTVRRVTFSGPDYITILHKNVPVAKPVPKDVWLMAIEYCSKAEKGVRLPSPFGRTRETASFLCVTQGVR